MRSIAAAAWNPRRRRSHIALGVKKNRIFIGEKGLPFEFGMYSLPYLAAAVVTKL